MGQALGDGLAPAAGCSPGRRSVTALEAAMTGLRFLTNRIGNRRTGRSPAPLGQRHIRNTRSITAVSGSCLSGAGGEGKGVGKAADEEGPRMQKPARSILGGEGGVGQLPPRWEGVGRRVPPVIWLEISHELCTSQTRPA